MCLWNGWVTESGSFRSPTCWSTPDVSDSASSHMLLLTAMYGRKMGSVFFSLCQLNPAVYENKIRDAVKHCRTSACIAAAFRPASQMAVCHKRWCTPFLSCLKASELIRFSLVRQPQCDRYVFLFQQGPVKIVELFGEECQCGLFIFAVMEDMLMRTAWDTGCFSDMLLWRQIFSWKHS